MTEESSIADEAAIDATVVEDVMVRAANLATAEMPLPAGLRAAAQESDSPRLAAALRSLASQMERGKTLDECLAGARKLPPYMAGLIRAAQRTGDMGLTLATWTENRRSGRQYWRSAIASLAYPALSLGVALAVFFLFANVVMPTFRKMFGEFGLRLPAATTYLFRATDFLMMFLPLLGLLILVIAVTTRIVGGRAGWSWLVSNVPLLGNVWYWSGVSEMLRGLGLLVQYHVPLPEALRLTAGGLSDAYVAEQCRNLASGVEGGGSLTMSLVRLRTLPLSIVPLVRWGEQHNALDEALRSAAELMEGRLRSRTHVLAQIVPPLVFIAVGLSLASAVIALFLPLISLIQGLS
ncbi:MAG TPA: type II secretion system F family protein [Pirellulaceae bacterium]|jgi:type II secretory pathway component PulF